MKIILATDHAGFDLKEQIKKELLKQNHDVEDFGAKQNNPMDDYPDFIIPASKFIANNTDLKVYNHQTLVPFLFYLIHNKTLYKFQKDILLLQNIHIIHGHLIL